MDLFLIAIVSTCFGMGDTPSAHPNDSRDLYELVWAATLELYPNPLREYVAKNLNQIQNLAVTPQAVATDDSKPTFAIADHFLKLDIAAKGADPTARNSAAHSFPKDHKSARALFEQHHEKDGGNLPWIIEVQFRQLQTAFESGTRESVNGQIAAITHFATDAAMPFSTTYDLNGDMSDQPKWCTASSASPESICSLRERFQRSLFTRNLDRLTYEVRVSPDRAKQIEDPEQAAFEVLIDSHDALLRIMEADRKTITELRIDDIEHFQAASDAYYSHLADRCGPILEERIESASLLAANLIRTAWIRAGRPNLNEKFLDAAEKVAGAQTSPKSDSKQPDQPAVAEKPFGGSVNSTIFHRVGCSHLQRVKPENVVYFATVEEAQSAGRTACKTCKP